MTPVILSNGADRPQPHIKDPRTPTGNLRVKINTNSIKDRAQKRMFIREGPHLKTAMTEEIVMK